MIQRERLSLRFCVIFLSAVIFVYPSFAEIKVFEKEVEAIVGEGQSEIQVESYAMQRAKRLAVEETGTYLSSLSVVQNYQLQKDEVTALASGIVRTAPVGLASVREANGVYYVKIKAKIEIDTSILDRQIHYIMKEKGALKELENERKKNKELEEKLENLKSSDAERIEELNTQAMALEKERDMQRLLLEEQALADRFAKEREMQEKISQVLADQEKIKREEAVVLAAEQDRIKRAQLENEHRWNDLARKVQLAQNQWGIIDDSLSLKQAITEVKDLKHEIANLKTRLDFQYNVNTKNLQAAYVQQRALTTAKLSPAPAPRDAFESMAEYDQRISSYEQQVKETEKETCEAQEMLKKEEALKLAEAKVEYLGQQIRVLAPFVQRLQDFQSRKLNIPEGGAMMVDLGAPDADNNRFPLNMQYKEKSWSDYWKYYDRETAKDFYRTRTYLKAEGLFQIEETTQLSPKLTAARVTHTGTNETREFLLETPMIFSEISQLGKFRQEEATAKASLKKTAKMLTLKEIGKDGRFIAYDDGTVLDTRTNLMWADKDNSSDINWQGAKSYCENYRGGGYSDWRMPTQDELAGLYDEGKTSKNKLTGGCYGDNQFQLWRPELGPPVHRREPPSSPGAVRQIDYLVI